MKHLSEQIQAINEPLRAAHQRRLDYLRSEIGDVEPILAKLDAFQVAIPSWALGTGGTRFGRFSGTGEPISLQQKIEDVGLLHALNKSSGAISLHFPWDSIEDPAEILAVANRYSIGFDAVNSNTFQDQAGQTLSYKYGSLHHVDPQVRKQAIEHNVEVIKQGIALGSKALTVWLADGSSFPGQLNFREAFQHTLSSLQEIYKHLPSDWKLFVEYKCFEPNFYSTTIADWGQSLLLATKLGEKAYTLVDLGHHLPNANIEQIVSILLLENKLGGFHFNDSKYADDDLTAGSIKPYQLFLIFNELVAGMDTNGMDHAKSLAWMIDASHNLKDPLLDLLQSVEAIKLAYAQALLVDRKALKQAQEENDVVQASEILQHAFRLDLRPLLAESRLRGQGALHPVAAYKQLGIRASLTKLRGEFGKATGL